MVIVVVVVVIYYVLLAPLDPHLRPAAGAGDLLRLGNGRPGLGSAQGRADDDRA